MFRKNKLFFWTSEILLLTIIFYLWRQMGAIITPFVSVANTIMIPFLLGGFLYYLTNPIVNFLQKYFKINRIIGILPVSYTHLDVYKRQLVYLGVYVEHRHRRFSELGLRQQQFFRHQVHR